MARRLLLPLAALCLLVGAGRAAADPVSGGTARLELNRELGDSLRRAGVRLQARGAAQLHGRRLVLPVSGGELEAGRGSIGVAGGLRLSAGRRGVVLGSLVLDSRAGVLVGKLAGRRLRLAVARRPRVRLDGFGYTVTLGKLVFTAAAARRIDRALGQPRLLAAEDTLGILNAGVRRSAVTVTHGTAYLGFDGAFWGKLHSLAVAGEALGGGWLYSRSPLTAALGKLHGGLALDLSSGVLESADGLRLFQGKAVGDDVYPVEGGAELTLQGVVVDLAGRTVSAQLAAPPSAGGEAAVFASLQIPVFHKNAFTGEISIPDSPLTLTSSLADLLNRTFVEPRGLPAAFAAGEPIGFLAFGARAH